jgi:hypothetical protein
MNQARPVAWLSKLFGREAGFSTAPFAQNANGFGRNDDVEWELDLWKQRQPQVLRLGFAVAQDDTFLGCFCSWVAFAFWSSYLEDDFGSELKFAGSGALGCGEARGRVSYGGAGGSGEDYVVGVEGLGAEL